MRALTVRQPWAFAICHAGKDVENRSWPIPPKLMPSVGECDPADLEPDQSPLEAWGNGPKPLRVALHAGKQWDPSCDDVLNGNTRFATLPDGTRVLARVGAKARRAGPEWVQIARTSSATRQPFGAVVAVIELTDCHQSSECAAWSVEMAANRGEYCSPWAEPGSWHWVIGDVTVLDTPVPARGRQGLWTPPEDVTRAVKEQTP